MSTEIKEREFFPRHFEVWTSHEYNQKAADFFQWNENEIWIAIIIIFFCSCKNISYLCVVCYSSIENNHDPSSQCSRERHNRRHLDSLGRRWRRHGPQPLELDPRVADVPAAADRALDAPAPAVADDDERRLISYLALLLGGQSRALRPGRLGQPLMRARTRRLLCTHYLSAAAPSELRFNIIETFYCIMRIQCRGYIFSPLAWRYRKCITCIVVHVKLRARSTAPLSATSLYIAVPCDLSQDAGAGVGARRDGSFGFPCKAFLRILRGSSPWVLAGV